MFVIPKYLRLEETKKQNIQKAEIQKDHLKRNSHHKLVFYCATDLLYKNDDYVLRESRTLVASGRYNKGTSNNKSNVIYINVPDIFFIFIFL